MNVFISYPSEEHALGERVNFALLAQGHDVFFDRDDLAPGHEYDMAIARAIDACDIFVFLITPASVSAGRYTLSELELVEQKWPHASGRVLPVLLRGTDIATVPAYLKAVNFLQPQGDVGAEIASAVRGMARSLSLTGRITRGVRSKRGAAIIAAALAIVTLGGAAATDRWPFAPSAAAKDSAAVTDSTAGTESTAAPDSNAATNSTAAKGRNKPPPDRVQPLPDDMRYRARAVVPMSNGEFVVATDGPSQVHRFSAGGERVGTPVAIEGEPVAAVSAPGQIFLITRAPDGVTVLHQNDLRVIATALLDPANVMKPRDLPELPRLSGDIQSVTALNGMLWVVTGERDGQPAILRYRTQEQRWDIPTWTARPEGVIGSDARGLSLRPFKDGLWAVSTASSPSSLYHFMGFVTIDEFRGRDIPMVSCAHDLAQSSSGHLIFLNCENELLDVRAEGKDLRLMRTRLTLPSESAPGNWTDQRIISDSSTTIVALNTHVNQPNNQPGRARIVEVDSAGAATTLLDRAGAVVHSMAATPTAVIAVLRLATGRFDVVRIRRGEVLQ